MIDLIANAAARAACCCFIAMMLAAGDARAGQSPAPASAARPVSVGIVPFTNLSRTAADRWIGEGIAETLAAELQGEHGLEVLDRAVYGREPVASTASGSDAVDEDAALRLTRELGGRWLVAGDYQRVGDRLRITSRLIDAGTGVAHAVRVDGTVGELFALQDRLAAALGARLRSAGAPARPAAAGPLAAPPPAAPPGPAAVATPASAAMPPRAPASGLAAPTLAIFGPPPPVAPDVVARDAAGRLTIRAVRLRAPIAFDGRLDDEIYATVPPLSDFVQQEPQEGAPATERTDVWVFFDDERVYFSFRCWETAPERVIANEMRRDNSNVYQNDHIAFVVDTFYDRRNALEFLVNPLGGLMDGQITNESMYNGDWNPIWDVAVGEFDGGWTVETAIPFKSIRYRRGAAQIWGFNVRRVSIWKNEHSFLTRVPASMGGSGIFLMSRAATLVGLEAPVQSTNLDIKPFAIMDVTSDHVARPPISNVLGGDAGLDVKYGVTQNLVADLTVNTDFAQVEADEQQVNLTRFSLFFPEKREFFLENQGLFAFGGTGSGAFRGNDTTPILFYSRRIGLHEGREVPIRGGGRLSGRMGRFSVGALNIQTGDTQLGGGPADPVQAANFTVLRVKRDVLRRSSIGGIFTRRAGSNGGPAWNEAYGLDGTFAFFDDLAINTYWAQTRAAERLEDDVSYRGQLDYAGDRYGVQLEHLVVGDNFNPEVGFLQRDDFERSYGAFRFSPRPHAIAAIRKLYFEGRLDYFTDRTGVVETRIAQGLFSIEFESSDRFDATYTRSYEFLDRPFPIASDVTIPIGSYRFQDVELLYSFGLQRRLSGGLGIQHGSFFGGEKTTARLGMGGFRRSGRFEVSPQISLEPGFEYNRITLPQGQFTTRLVTTRTTYTVTPRMFVSALLQYNSTNNSLGANVRLRWEYQPGSELFVVYNEQRDTLIPRLPVLQNRAFIVKFNRLFRF